MLCKPLQDSLRQVDTLLKGIESLPATIAHKVYCEQRVGSHVRHISDHFTALLCLTDSDTVDYNHRTRNSPIETDIDQARVLVAQLIDSVESAEFGSREVECISEVDISETKSATFTSTADREALWVFNHTIHHIALIKLLAENAGLQFDSDLGVAPATATFQRSGQT